RVVDLPVGVRSLLAFNDNVGQLSGTPYHASQESDDNVVLTLDIPESLVAVDHSTPPARPFSSLAALFFLACRTWLTWCPETPTISEICGLLSCRPASLVIASVLFEPLV